MPLPQKTKTKNVICLCHKKPKPKMLYAFAKNQNQKCYMPLPKNQNQKKTKTKKKEEKLLFFYCFKKRTHEKTQVIFIKLKCFLVYQLIAKTGKKPAHDDRRRLKRCCIQPGCKLQDQISINHDLE